MSLARDIFDRVFHPNRDVHAIPVLDGGFSPNRRLDEAEVATALPGVAALCAHADGLVHAASGNRILRWPRGDFSAATVFAELDAAVTAIAAHPDGRIIAALVGRGLVAIGEGGTVTARLEIAGNAPLACVTALAILPDGSIAITDGSRHNDAEHWLQDLMEKRAGSGRLVVCKADLTAPRIVRDGLSWPSGVAVSGPDTLLVTEAWAHQLLRITIGRGEMTVLVKNFAGYPSRLSPAASGGFWVAFFAMRTQLIEFVLREDAFRARMMQSVPAPLWIGPTLGDHFDYREPTQIGRIKKLGIQKPWAPPRSYGLVARIDASGEAHESLHSRVSGQFHGVVDVVEADGQLIIASRGHGKLARINLQEGKGL